MKCVSINGVKSFKLEERSCPEKRKDKVVFKVNKCGICGSDLHYFVNGEPKGLVMGHEFSGVIVDPGERSDLKKQKAVIIKKQNRMLFVFYGFY